MFSIHLSSLPENLSSRNIKYVGLDVHKAISVIVVLDERGQFESRAQVKTKAEPLGDFFRGLSGKVTRGMVG